MAGADARRLRPGRRDRPALHPLHVGHDRQAEGRRARQRRSRGRAALDHAQRLRHRRRRRVVGRLRRRLGRRPLLHRVRAAARRARRPCSTRASRSARRTPARSGGSIAEHGVKALFTAPTAIRAIKKEDPDGGTSRQATTCPACVRCSSPASGSIRTPTTGRRRQLGVPVDRPLVADRDRLADRGQPDGRRTAADQAGLADGADAGLRRAGPRRRRQRVRTPARRARSASSCRCRRARCRRCGATTSATSRLPVEHSRLLPDRRRRLRRRGRLPVRDGPHRRRHQRGRAPAVDRRAWRRCSPRIRPSPSAR